MAVSVSSRTHLAKIAAAARWHHDEIDHHRRAYEEAKRTEQLRSILRSANLPDDEVEALAELITSALSESAVTS